MKLCERLDVCGLIASADKSKLGVETLSFFGLKLSKNGVALGDDKVRAILSAGAPAGFGELHSLLGLAQYCTAISRTWRPSRIRYGR